jgi:hypothetical protein
MLNEGNQIHNFMSCSGSGSDFLTSYGSGYGSGSTSQKVTVPTVPVPVPVPQHCYKLLNFSPKFRESL